MSTATSSSGRNAGKTISFAAELQSMMFSLGDARRPLHETAVLVEDVVHTQLINLLQQAAEVSQLRGARVISAEDLLFLMRKDKKKLRRLLKYMFIRDYKSKIIKGIDEDDLLEEKLSGSSGTNKRQKIAQDLINSIDQTGELLAMFEDNELDDVKQERMEGSSCLKSSPDSPENTPPPTPTAPSSGSQHAGRAASGSLGNGSTGQDSAKTKQRKRKKSTAACGVEAHSDAIQPCHIREAIRRYGHKIGPLSPFTSAYRRSGTAFLAC